MHHTPTDAPACNRSGLDRCVKLRSLDVSFNAIDAATGLEALADLRELKLYCNRLSSIAGVDRASPTLTTLLLQSNQLQPPPPTAAAAPSLSALCNLSFLRIDNNSSLGEAGLAALGLGSLSKLTELNASGTGLTSAEPLRGLSPTLETVSAPKATRLLLHTWSLYERIKRASTGQQYHTDVHTDVSSAEPLRASRQRRRRVVAHPQNPPSSTVPFLRKHALLNKSDTHNDDDDMLTPEKHLPAPGQREHSPQRHTAAVTAARTTTHTGNTVPQRANPTQTAYAHPRRSAQAQGQRSVAGAIANTGYGGTKGTRLQRKHGRSLAQGRLFLTCSRPRVLPAALDSCV